MNYSDVLKEKLKKYKIEDIFISEHAIEQAVFRGISSQEIKQNIINPKRLIFARRQRTESNHEEKYDCYFVYGKMQCHRYVLVLNKRCIVCTVIKINRHWQHIMEKNAKI